MMLAKHDKIRGVRGAYDKAINTLKELTKLRDNYGLHVGVTNDFGRSVHGCAR